MTNSPDRNATAAAATTTTTTTADSTATNSELCRRGIETIPGQSSLGPLWERFNFIQPVPRARRPIQQLASLCGPSAGWPAGWRLDDFMQLLCAPFACKRFEARRSLAACCLGACLCCCCTKIVCRHHTSRAERVSRVSCLALSLSLSLEASG